MKIFSQFTDFLEGSSKSLVPTVFILLKSGAQLSSPSNLARLKEISGDKANFVVPSDEGGLVANWNGYDFAAFIVNKSVPQDEFYSSFRLSLEKAALKKKVARHKAHLVVTLLKKPDGMGSAIESSIALMTFARMLSLLAESLAFYWSTSQSLVSDRLFDDALHQTLSAKQALARGDNSASLSLPVWLWVKQHLFTDAGHVAARSHGLAAFTGYEIEMDYLQWPAADLRERHAGVLGYIFEHGPILRDGDTIRLSKGEEFHAVFRNHPATGDPVLVLGLDKSKAN